MTIGCGATCSTAPGVADKLPLSTSACGGAAPHLFFEPLHATTKVQQVLDIKSFTSPPSTPLILAPQHHTTTTTTTTPPTITTASAQRC
ncbi:uncharacterized protein H6S33_010683 [Morchella sextelata]|uniref:uncharacterized protein n=1 Tax=Morchella sextelata TaxID=1174677 RepID=UPI001D056F3D|nr:uncharacterized protein H6S33_010683 [Morchella sextelata]KAH0611418.1 hypothetical protein H6S33_010683 [Morchella sextelata]